jgi:hypothetical protein
MIIYHMAIWKSFSTEGFCGAGTILYQKHGILLNEFTYIQHASGRIKAK